MGRPSFGLGFLAVALVACGGGDGSSAPSSTPSPTDTSVSLEVGADFDVDGRKMHIQCVGPTDTGEPTILLEAGGGLDTRSGGEVLNGMRSSHRLCAYDRAGLGFSEPPAERSRTSADQIADLHTLLDEADVSGPFVIGAHSYGATLATLFTQAYPDDVVGLVFVDPQGPAVTAKWLEALPAPSADEPHNVTRFRHEVSTFDTDPSLNPEHLLLRSGFASAAAALDAPGPLFGDRPVLVLSAGKKQNTHLPPKLDAHLKEIFSDAQQQLVDESTAGTRRTVPGAGHTIQVEKAPAVIHALEQVVAELTST